MYVDYRSKSLGLEHQPRRNIEHTFRFKNWQKNTVVQIDNYKKRNRPELAVSLSGAEGNRTPVQTYSSKAFYMLISLLIVGDEPETNKPIHHLAG